MELEIWKCEKCQHQIEGTMGVVLALAGQHVCGKPAKVVKIEFSTDASKSPFAKTRKPKKKEKTYPKIPAGTKEERVYECLKSNKEVGEEELASIAGCESSGAVSVMVSHLRKKHGVKVRCRKGKYYYEGEGKHKVAGEWWKDWQETKQAQILELLQKRPASQKELMKRLGIKRTSTMCALISVLRHKGYDIPKQIGFHNPTYYIIKK
jgi:biotin operon repressor